jgi:1-acyl-sn-glycerol-3-phosphate acyltransferase
METMAKRHKMQSTITEKIAKAVIKLLGWKAVGKMPNAPKYILVGYPHTSNYDTLIGIFIFLSMGVHIKWIGKQSLFKGPVGWLLKKTGGIPVNRQKSQNFVKNIQTVFNKYDRLVIALSPEGTRQKTDFWRTGFYYMALAAQVPIVLGYLDYPTKTGGFGPLIWPSGNIKQDMEKIRAFYQGIHGKYPQLEGAIRIKEKKQEKPIM